MSLNSNNPFRKRTSVPPLVTSSQQHHEPTNPRAAASLFDITNYDPSTPFKPPPTHPIHHHRDSPPSSPEVPRKKPVKKVQIQTPPPLSPSTDDESSSDNSYQDDDRQADPFDGQDTKDNDDNGDTQTPTIPARHVPERLSNHDTTPKPKNPFSKTLRDFEPGARTHEEPAPRQTPVHGRKSLDVDAFKRLLLTGSTGLDPSPDTMPRRSPTMPLPLSSTSTMAPPQLSHETATARPSPPSRQHGGGNNLPLDRDSTSTTDASRQSSLFDAIPESPMGPGTPHEAEETGSLAASPAPAPQRKKQPPPAPASRHGKLILKMGLGKDSGAKVASPSHSAAASPPVSLTAPPGNAILPRTLHRSPSDINKPLPPSPMPPAGAEESPFDKEAAGKVPEVEERVVHVAMLQGQPPTLESDSVEVPPLPATTLPTSTATTTATTIAVATEAAAATTVPVGVAPKPLHRENSLSKRASAPVPPPTRRHTRGESKILATSAVVEIMGHGHGGGFVEEPGQSLPRRASVDSNRSSIRAGNAPVPPPPRRVAGHGRGGLVVGNHSNLSPVEDVGVRGHVVSPSTVSLPSPGITSYQGLGQAQRQGGDDVSMYSVASEAPPVPSHKPLSPMKGFVGDGAVGLGHGRTESGGNGSGRLGPPPVPPARNSSVRRGGSVDISVVARKVVVGAPPPPPPRGRGRGDSKGREVVGIIEEAVTVDGSGGKDGGAATEILADLDALQKDVDALRGKYEMVGDAVALGGMR